MQEKVKNLLSQLLFLSPSQKERLIKQLPRFSPEDLEKMFEAFSILHTKENGLIKDLFSKNPSMANQAEAFIKSIEEETRGDINIQQKMQKLSNMNYHPLTEVVSLKFKLRLPSVFDSLHLNVSPDDFLVHADG